MCPSGAAFTLQPAVFSLLCPHAEIGIPFKFTCYVPGPNYECKCVLSKSSSKTTNRLTSGLIALTTLNVVTTRVTAYQQSCWKVCSTIWKWKAWHSFYFICFVFIVFCILLWINKLYSNVTFTHAQLHLHVQLKWIRHVCIERWMPRPTWPSHALIVQLVYKKTWN